MKMKCKCGSTHIKRSHKLEHVDNETTGYAKLNCCDCGRTVNYPMAAARSRKKSSESILSELEYLWRREIFMDSFTEEFESMSRGKDILFDQEKVPAIKEFVVYSLGHRFPIEKRVVDFIRLYRQTGKATLESLGLSLIDMNEVSDLVEDYQKSILQVGMSPDDNRQTN